MPGDERGEEVRPAGPTFAAVGHVTDDLLRAPGGVEARTPGGSALYAGLAAAALGARVRVVTACAAEAAALGRLEAAGVAVHRQRSAVTTTFENDHRGGGRVQRVRAVAAPIATEAVASDVVFVCPVAGEIRGAPAAFGASGALVGVGLQGFLRAIDADGVVGTCAMERALLDGVAVAFVSREDLGFDDRAVAAIARAVPTLVVTDGAAGATIHRAGCAPTHVRAAPARELEPTGAGDLFATAFLLATARGADPVEAAIEGACAGAIAVEAVGVDAVAGLAALRDRREAWRCANGP